MIEIKQLSFSYPGSEPILKNVSFTIGPGETIGVMGGNGSGKTTLARCLNGLYEPTSGDVVVDGINTKDHEAIYEVHRRVGLVFQNPDHQIVATTVEREIAFGLENLAIEHAEMLTRVNEALEKFDLARYRQTEPHMLSGGERQRLALAAVWVMRPGYYVMDEPTSLLDPAGREIIRDFIKAEAAQNHGVLMVTQYAEDALGLDRLIVLDKGEILTQGAPESVFKELSGNASCKINIPLEFEIEALL